MTLDWRNLPPILTSDEAVVVLRLDADDAEPVSPDVLRKRLQRLVDSGLIRPARIGKSNRFLLAELLRFATDATDRRGDVQR